MRITLTKKLKNDSGKVLPVGLVLGVTREYGLQLIEAGKAVNNEGEPSHEIIKELNKE